LGREVDPEALELRRQALELQRDRLGIGRDREGRLAQQDRERFDPAEAENTRQLLESYGIPRERIANMSNDELKQVMSILGVQAKESPEIAGLEAKNAANQARGVAQATMQPRIDTAAGISAATKQDKIDIAREGAAARGEAEAQSPAFKAQQDARYAANADQYWKATEFYRTGAVFMNDAEQILSKYPAGSDVPGVGMADSRKPEWGLDADGLRLRKAQDWMNNAIQRADSGAAAPVPEELKFAIRSGAAPGATEAQFREGMRAASMYLRGQLASASAGKEAPAREVLRNQGIEGWVFPAAPAAKPLRETRRPDQKPRPGRVSTTLPGPAVGAVISAEDLAADEDWDDL
jgi:hypothetical protein